MRRTKSIVGLLLFSAICLCAFAAGSASAMTLHECKAESGTSTEYTSSTCATKGAGGFHTVPIVGKAEVVPTLTETNFTGTTGEEAGTHAVLHAVVAGTSVQITCTELTSTNSTVENKEVGGVMTFEGTGKTVFKGCTVKKPTTCTVPSELTTVELKQTTNEMNVIFKPVSGSTFITITFSGASCPSAIKGEKPITGEAVGTVAEGEPQAISFNSSSGNKLKLGEVEGAQFTAKIHFATKSNGTLLAAETP